MTWGLLIIVLNLAYVGFSVFCGFLITFFTKSIKVGVLVFFIVFMIPYWDLFVQLGVKSYYSVFKLEDKIYGYPEFDKNGKVESLDLTESYGSNTIKHFTKHLNLKYKENTFKDIPITEFKMNNFMKRNNFDDRVKKFIDRKVFDDFRIVKKVRIRFDDIKPQFIFIEKSNARYRIVSKSYKYLWELYKINELLLIDNKTNKILVQQRGINFKTGDKDKFRNKYLLLKSANDIPFKISSIKSNGSIKKILKIDKL